MRYVDTETGEIFDLVQSKRFQKAQKRLTRQSMPLWQLKRKHQRWSRETQWWLKLVGHLGPMVIFGTIAIALMLHAK